MGNKGSISKGTADVPSSGLEGTVKDVQEALPPIQEGKEPGGDRSNDPAPKSDPDPIELQNDEQASKEEELVQPSAENDSPKPSLQEEPEGNTTSPINKRKRSSGEMDGVENCTCQGCSCQPCQCDPCRCDNTLQIQDVDKKEPTNEEGPEPKDVQPEVNGDHNDEVFNGCQCQDCPCMEDGKRSCKCECKNGGQCLCKSQDVKKSCECGCKDGQECQCSSCPDAEAEKQAQCHCENKDCKAINCECGCLKADNKENNQENIAESDGHDKENTDEPNSPTSPKLIINEEPQEETCPAAEIASVEPINHE